MNINAKWNEDKTGVSVGGDYNGFVPTSHRFWYEWGIDKLESDGLIEPYQNEDDGRLAFESVDDTRRNLYGRMVDPLLSEAAIKRIQGHNGEAQELELQALAARAKIQEETPYPTR